MTEEQKGLVDSNYFLEPGYIFLPEKPHSISAVMGSSVSVCLYDRRRNVGGMNLFQLPLVRERHLATPRYGNVAILALIRMMLKGGSRVKDLEAQIMGGANKPETIAEDMGRENIGIARKVLKKERVRVTSEDVGGEKGRKIVFNTGTNELAIIKVDRLRAGDWYPYQDNR